MYCNSYIFFPYANISRSWFSSIIRKFSLQLDKCAVQAIFLWVCGTINLYFMLIAGLMMINKVTTVIHAFIFTSTTSTTWLAIDHASISCKCEESSRLSYDTDQFNPYNGTISINRLLHLYESCYFYQIYSVERHQSFP